MNRHPEGQSGTLQVDEIDDTVSSFSGELLRGSGWQYLLDLLKDAW